MFGELDGRPIPLDDETLERLDETVRARIVVTREDGTKIRPFRFGSFGGQTFVESDGTRVFSIGG